MADDEDCLVARPHAREGVGPGGRGAVEDGLEGLGAGDVEEAGLLEPRGILGGERRKTYKKGNGGGYEVPEGKGARAP